MADSLGGDSSCSGARAVAAASGQKKQGKGENR